MTYYISKKKKKEEEALYPLMKMKKIKIEILNIYDYHFYCKVDNDILQKEKKVKLSSSYQHGFMSNSTTS